MSVDLQHVSEEQHHMSRWRELRLMGFGLRGRGILVQGCLSKVLKQQMLKWGPAMNWQLIQGCTLPLPIRVSTSRPQKGVIYSQPLTALVLRCKNFESKVCNSSIRLHMLTCGWQALPLSQCFKIHVQHDCCWGLYVLPLSVRVFSRFASFWPLHPIYYHCEMV